MTRSVAVLIAAVAIGAFTSASQAQSYSTEDPNSAPLASPTGGKPVPVDLNQVRKDNTADPGSAPLASPTGGRPVPVDPRQVRTDDTTDPGSSPLASR